MDKETYTFEDRVYVNPEVSRDEQLGFIDKLRSIQQEGAEKIARDTHNLGTDVTPNLGGLNGAESIWSAQYVTPKVETMASSLRTAAQAQALNDVLSNYQEQMKKRYNDAYSAAQRRAGGGGGGDGGKKGGGGEEGEIDWKTSGKKYGLEYDSTSGTLDSGPVGRQLRYYYILTKDGQRKPLNVIGSGDNIVVETEKSSLIGKDAVNNYMSNVYKNGGKLLQRTKDGKVVDIGSGPTKHHSVWGI